MTHGLKLILFASSILVEMELQKISQASIALTLLQISQVQIFSMVFLQRKNSLSLLKLVQKNL